MINIIKKDRLIMLDAIRILSALFVFLFHSNIHIGATYSILTRFISQGAIFMVAFFILSGFSLYYNYNDLNLNNLSKMITFYIKRLIGVYPLYIAVYILYLIFRNALSIKQNILIAPVELLLMQSYFDGTFDIN